MIIFKQKPKWERIIVANLLVLFLVIQPVSSVMAFSDVEWHWSKPVVTRAATLDFIKGYPDNSFQPEKEISQMEALVLFMRAVGLGNGKTTAKKSKKEAPRPLKSPEVPWGQNYMDTAVENELLDDKWLSSFQADRPATRLQVVSLLCRLLQLPLPDSVSSGQNAFSDLDSTSSEYIPYIIALSQAGIMKGYEDGTFRPERGLKRSEAAALLSSLIEQNWVKTDASRILEGWVEKIIVDKNKGEIELRSLSGVKKVKLDPGLQCFAGVGECQLRDTLDYRVEVLLNQKKQAACISIIEKRKFIAAEDKITGTVKSVLIGLDSILVLSDLNCEERRLPLSWGALIDSEGKARVKDFTSLKPGTYVTVQLAEGQVQKVTVLETKTISGTIKDLSGRRLTLAKKGSSSKSGKPEWFNYWDRARMVDKDGRVIGRVSRGDAIKVTYLDPNPGEIDDEIPLEIMLSSRPGLKKVKAEVEKLTILGDYYKLTVKKNKDYEVDKSVQLYSSSGGEIQFNNLNAGDKVEMEVDGAGVVIKITVL
ncbi:S-layer homology domain-containing protein [Syntrophomonas wolfei]|uniref:S-layer homology domain-containing protein n=1 Tax=Syntrophomonas wolfei TaxID=863 RepID=UPI000774B224|nr:S-layer homology domain-containing protein [Syntrophomonas wolfei]